MRPAHLDECRREALARAIHEDYVARATTNQGPVVDREGSAPYQDLSEETRESNRKQADDIEVKLEMIGAAIVPLDRGRDPFAFTSSELERLSRHEHARWMREKLQAGWRFGPAIDPVARTHPCLVEYHALPEEERKKDRQVVERIPTLLRAVGLGIARREPRQILT